LISRSMANSTSMRSTASIAIGALLICARLSFGVQLQAD
jgi:hypothetical protein